MEHPPRQSSPSEIPPGAKEYLFEEGVQVAVDRIKELYEASDKDVIVEINGSGVNVGKTELLKQLAQKLGDEGIFLSVLNDPTQAYYEEAKKLETAANSGVSEKRVYIVATTIGKMYHSTEEYRSLKLEGEVSVDLYIGIYRPDKPFGKDGPLAPVADIMIRNKGARDKPRI